MRKEKRQQTILDLIRARNIETQDELTASLSKKGFSATQSSVSRDLDELGMVKINGYYSLPQAETKQDFGLFDLKAAGENLIVAKCGSGLASAVCVRIDRAKIAEIVGTIAGDDTIFIAVKDRKSQKAAVKIILEMFEK
ncbi:MAG: arginine repressor [Acidobacteria bacterium]|nr:arginine repressor [Acidobacteriota bacterium]MCA1638016.1 arginine repressor [Acidobacteriota bacterium]